MKDTQDGSPKKLDSGIRSKGKRSEERVGGRKFFESKQPFAPSSSSCSYAITVNPFDST